MIQRWPVRPYKLGSATYDCREHARWAHFFRFWYEESEIEYQPKHIPISDEFGFRPTFFIRDTWWHCINGIPSPGSATSAFMVAVDTGQRFVLVEPLFVPRIAQNPPSPRLLMTEGYGDRRQRYFAVNRNGLGVAFNKYSPECYTRPLIDAFTAASVV